MTRTEKLEILFRLGKILKHLGEGEKWESYDLGINQTEYESLESLVENVNIYNGWFTPKEVRKSFLGIATWLEKSRLENFLASYNWEDLQIKRVAIIMAGNIPLVGFHDLICTFLAGHKVLIKLSSDDDRLIPALIEIMALFHEEIKDTLVVAQGKLEGFDAVIATGSDNSASHFQEYFGKYPHIIRKHRTSVAVLKGNESEEELKALGNDIFDFYGLGCRNVSKIFIPKEFDLNRFFEAIFDFGDVINHHKYANNYDYNKAVYLMNQVPILDNNFLILKEDNSMHSPLGVLLYERYDDSVTIENKLAELKEDLQVVVGDGFTPFGQAQNPKIDDFADKVDTMKFLTTLTGSSKSEIRQ